LRKQQNMLTMCEQIKGCWYELAPLVVEHDSKVELLIELSYSTNSKKNKAPDEHSARDNWLIRIDFEEVSD